MSNTTTPAPIVRSGYIVTPVYDGLFFIGSPILALIIGIAISGTPWSNERISVFGHRGSFTHIFIGAFIMAHLVIVFFRSHANTAILRQYPLRFSLVPVALLAAMLSSKWILVAVSVLATWWDVYHSSLQTFGLGRIYDAKAGNHPQVGRRLDIMLNILLYAGPILAGATLMDHVNDFNEFSEVGSVFFTSIPAYVESNRRFLTWAVTAVSIPFFAYYVWAYVQHHRQGYRVSFQKMALLVSTGVCSVYTWGFNTFGEAFFIMNFFHAFQYFAIVWWSEQKTMIRLFRLGGLPYGKPLALMLFLLIGFGYGLWAEVSDVDNQWAMSVVLTVAIMHFWYDGFIWSVRKRQV